MTFIIKSALFRYFDSPNLKLQTVDFMHDVLL
jgi:hypothetical protein